MRSLKITGGYYFILFLTGGDIGGSFKDGLRAICTNQKAVGEITGIGRYRLNYWFTKRGRDYFKNDEVLIIKVSNIYRGSQYGGTRNKGLNRR